MSTYHATINDDGDGNFSAVLRRGGIAASGGTTLAGAGDSKLANETTFVGEIVEKVKTVILNDRAAGN